MGAADSNIQRCLQASGSDKLQRENFLSTSQAR